MLFADPTLIVLGICGIAYLVMLIALLRGALIRRGAEVETGVPSQTTWLLALYVFLSVGWVIFQGLQRLQSLRLIGGFDIFALQRIELYFLTGLAGIFFMLTRLFQRRTGRGLAWWLSWVVWLAVGVILYENFFRLPEVLLVVGGNGLILWLLAYWVLVAAWAFYMGTAVIYTARNHLRAASPLHRNRAVFWVISTILAAVGEILFLLQFNDVGNVLHLAAVFVAVYAMLTHNLTDLRMALRRSVRALVMLALTVAAYTGAYYAITRIFGSLPGYTPLLIGIILALALTVLLNPLLNLVQRFVAHLITGLRYDIHHTLSEYSMSISNILELDVLATVAIGLVSETMEITRGALITVHQETTDQFWRTEGSHFRLHTVSGMGQELQEGRLSFNNPVVYHLSREHHPLTQYDIDFQPRFHSMEAEERAWLSGLQMDVYVPIYAKDAWIGLLALGPKASGDRYYDNDLVLLQTIADQTAVALENARLFEDLKQRNADNERLNAELQNANVELSRLDKAKSDFINIASHELRTPLTQVIGYNDILGDMIREGNIEPGVGGQMIDSVRKAARRLEEIVETMFDVSKLEAKTLDLARAPVSLASIISVAVDTWKKGMEERKQSMSVRGIANLPTVVGDGKRLTQVFSHLVQNAIKSTPDGGQIRVSGRLVSQEEEENLPAREGSPDSNPSAEPTLKSERYIEIIVSDTGIGIAPEDLDRIFEKFYRVGNVLLHSTGDTKFKGAGPGLGLTIARGIIEAHGGRIWAESPGHDEENCPGARFIVLLPVRSITDNDIAPRLAAQEK